MSLGEKRRKLAKRARDTAAYAAAIAPLVAKGANCESCKHYERVPLPGDKRHHCSIDSDSDGYTVTARDAVCPLWAGRIDIAPKN